MRTIRFRSASLTFPEGCAICLIWPHDRVPFERTFIYGRGSRLLKLGVPLCYKHARQAIKKSNAQVRCSRIAWILGILISIVSTASLLVYWQKTGQGRLLWNIPLAIVVGLSFGFTIWAALTFWVVPLFASKETKAVFRSVRMTRYDPFRNLLDVCFENETFAELTARKNLSLLDMDTTGLKHYHIETRFQCDDVRLLGDLKSDVLLDHAPSENELYKILEPETEMKLIQHGGVDCPYRLFGGEIKEIS